MRKLSLIAVLVALCVAVAASRSSAQKITKDDVANEALNAAANLDKVTNGLAANVAAATKQLPAWQKEAAAIDKLRDAAKTDANAANTAAQAALAAAKKCDQKEYEKQKALADKATAKANKEKADADKREKTLVGQLDALSNQMSSAEKAAAKAVNDGQSFQMNSNNSSALGKLKIAEDKYNNALSDSPGQGPGEPSKENTPGLRSLQTFTQLVHNTLSQSHRDNDQATADALKAADQALKDAAAALKDCPPKEGAMYVPPGKPTDVYVAVDSRCGTNVDLCNLEGQDSRPVADSLGMQDCSAIATTTTDAVYHCPGDAKRADDIRTRAKEKDKCVGFAEENYCIIESPVTPQRTAYGKPAPLVIRLPGGSR